MIDKRAGRHLSGIMPGTEPITLLQRGSGANSESFTPLAVPRARRKPATKEDRLSSAVEVGNKAITWQVYDTGIFVPTGGQSQPPKVGDKITDQYGATFEVCSVPIRLLQGVYDCVCVQDI